MSVDNSTQFPSGTKDADFQVRMMEAKWKRFFPIVVYHPILKATKPANPANLNVPANESGATGFDGLWNESIDSTSVSWTQPHLSGTTIAAPVEVYGSPVSINMREYAEDVDGDLKDWGIEKKLDLTVTVPASLLTSAGVTAQPGDWFLWANDPYEVRQVGLNRRYLNTPRVFYAVLNCTSKRQGS